MNYIGRRVGALVLAIVLLLTLNALPATTALALETKPIVAETAAEQVEMDDSESADPGEDTIEATSTQNNAGAEMEPAENSSATSSAENDAAEVESKENPAEDTSEKPATAEVESKENPAGDTSETSATEENVTESGLEDEQEKKPLAEMQLEAEPAEDAITAQISLGANSKNYTVYRDLDFEKADSLGYTWRNPYKAPDNTWLNQSENGRNGGHALTVTQNTSSQKYFDVGELQNANNGTVVSGQDLILEQDVYLEESHPDMLLFYLGDNKNVEGVDKTATLVEIVGNSLKYDEQTTSISTGEWHRISAAVHFSTHTYEIYLDGKIVYENLSFNEDVALLCYWRTLIYESSTLNSVVHYDNMRIYDGTKPRMLDGEKNIYKNLKFENSANLGINWQQTNGNKIEWQKDDDGNGYVLFDKCTQVANANQMLMDINDAVLTSKHIVYDVDVMPKDEQFAGALFWLRQDVGATQITATLIEVVSGKLKYGETCVPLEIGKWNRVTAVVDFENFRYDIYLNGEPLAQFQNMSLRTDLQNPFVWRVLGYGWSPCGAIGIDNMRIYDGTEPRDLDSEAPTEHPVFSDEKALAFLRDKTALHTYGGTLYYNNAKVDVKEAVQTAGDDAFVTADVFEKLFGVSVVENGDTVTADNATFTVGSKTVIINGASVTLAAAPKHENNALWLPIAAYGQNAVTKGCYYDDNHGMFVVSKSAFDAATSPTKEANQYLFFARKTPEQLKNMLLANTNNDLTTHPRLFANADDFEVLRSEVQTNSYKSEWYSDIQRRADNLLTQEPLTYVISNGRLLDVANSALTRMEILGMSWQITREQKYADRLIQELDAISQFADWHPEHTLDTGTMAMAAAIGYDWGYDGMTAEQRTTFADRLYNVGLKTARAAYYGTADFPTWWTNTETNWGGVVNAGFMNLAIAIAEKDPDYAMDIVANAKRGMEATIYRIAPDGAWYEGPGYWSYLFQSLSYEMAGYESAFGETDDVVSFKGMDGFAQYQMYFSDPSGNVNNFHDSDEGPIGCFGMFYLAKKFDQPALMNYRASFITSQNQTPTVYDLLWYDVNAANSTDSAELALDCYYRETELVTMRQEWNNENALWVSAHGGSINTAHDHIDAGTFVMNLGGVRWAVDLAKEPYSYVPDDQNPAIKAGLNSYYFYRRKGEGHNVVVINPDSGLEMDQAYDAKIVKTEFGLGRSYAVVDLSDVYNKNANSYLRGYLVSDGRSALTVRDEIDLKQDNSELYWFMHTEGQVVIEDNNTAYILQDGKQLKLQFVTDAAESELSVMPAEKLPTSAQFEESENIGVQKVALKLEASGKVNITVKMSLVGEDASNAAPETTAIANWTTVGDDTVQPSATGCTQRLLGIKINGENLETFKPEIFHYTYSLGKDENEANVTAQANTRTEILSHTMLNGHDMKEIRVYDSAMSSSHYTTYVIEIKPYDPYSPSQYSRYAVVGVQASSYQTDIGNIPEYSYDGDMSTRWSAEGVGEWCVHDLGEEKRIDAFGVALWMGAQREFYFDVEVSNDGVNFTPVVKDYTSCGNTEDIEVILLDESVNARYVRYMGKGNSVNAWNNVIELASYVDKKALSGGDSENSGGDSGNSGGDSGNSGGDSGNSGSDSGNSGSDSGNSGSDSGNSSGNNGGPNSNTGTQSGESKVSSPRMGDNSPLLFGSLGLILSLALCSCLVLIVYNRKKSE